MKKKVLIAVLAVVGALAVLGAVLFLCIWNGVILLNNPSLEKYPVRGVDVSAYQGEIDWAVLSEQEGIAFAYIKATEGSGFVDGRFEYNYTEAQKTKLRVGAYHFFSFESAGKTQAENFIKNVTKTDNMLPPVVDLEFYGKYWDKPLERDEVQAELNDMLALLEQYYGMKPVIYLTEETYSAYVEGAYEDYDIWYRNVYTSSGLPDGRGWAFWQYTNRERLDGYKGDEKFIDMNVFFGTEEQFENYGY